MPSPFRRRSRVRSFAPTPEPKEEGWLIAVEYYASRDLRWEQLWLYWEHCDEQWQKRRPASYPTFDEWCHKFQSWPFPPPKGKGATWNTADRVSPEQLKKAVSDYQAACMTPSKVMNSSAITFLMTKFLQSLSTRDKYSTDVRIATT